MTCEELRELAPLYLSGEMDQGQRAAFSAHLSGCTACEQELESLGQVDARVQRAYGGELPDASQVESRVRWQIAGEQRRRRWAFGGAIAATLLIGLAGYGWMFRHESPAPGWYADAARDHRVEVIEGQPRRWRFDAAEMEKVSMQSGLTLAQVQGLAGPGYTLERAKICGLGGQRMLHLVFSDGSRRYSLFVGPHAGEKAPVRQVKSGNEEIAGFETGSRCAVVVTEGGAVECQGLALLAASRL